MKEARIPMLELDHQHAPLRASLRAAFDRVLDSGRYVLGDEVGAFEHELAQAVGARYAVGVSSGSDALLALLMSCGIGPGDEVVTTPFSFFATTEAVLRLGARPVFADIDPATLNIDPDHAARKIGPRTRAVLVVHLFGRMAAVERLGAACAAAGVPLLEDAAQAIGARDLSGNTPRAAGEVGLAAALSFFPTKNLGGFGDGGMVVTNDGALAERVKKLRSHGAAAKHRHDLVGGNFRLDELQAALLRAALPRLEDWSAERRRLADEYRRRLEGTPLELPPPDEGCVWNQFAVRVRADLRPRLVAHLAARDIASAIYYPVPIHLQPAAAPLGHRPGDFPEAESAAREVLSLPLFPGLGDGRLVRVADAVKDFFR